MSVRSTRPLPCVSAGKRKRLPEDGELTRSMVLFATLVSEAAYAKGSVLESERKSAR